MTEASDRLFQMYQESMNGLCAECRRLDKIKKRRRNGPISFWQVGSSFQDGIESKRVAFVGKTSWMDPTDLEGHVRSGPVWNCTKDFNELWEKYSATRGYRYWRSVRRVADGLKLTSEDIFITNLAKCNVLPERKNSYVNITDWEYVSNCIGIFEKEIQITKPSHVIFFTGTNYDSLIDKLSFGYEGKDYSMNDITDKDYMKRISQKQHIWWWHRAFYSGDEARLHFLRTRHPQGAPRQFEDKIIGWVSALRAQNVSTHEQ
jgi:hypothetical protein